MCYKFTYDAEVEYDLSTFASFIPEDHWHDPRIAGLDSGSRLVLPSEPGRILRAEARAAVAPSALVSSALVSDTNRTLVSDTRRDKTAALVSDTMAWGFTGRDGRLLINARSETVRQKPTFVESFAERRCVIPARSFFERNLSKEEVRFERPDRGILYMAGLYRKEQGRYRFTVLTTEPHRDLRRIHDRTPLLLPKELVETWILDDRVASELLRTPAPLLHTYQAQEQLSLL